MIEAEVREKLKSEQRAVLDLVLAGHNVFITGVSDKFSISNFAPIRVGLYSIQVYLNIHTHIYIYIYSYIT